MDSQEVSAFAAFSQKKAKSLEKKSKLKQKKKEKSRHEGVIGSPMKPTTNVKEPSGPPSEIPKKKIKKKDFVSKDLIKRILQAQRQSLFVNSAAEVNSVNSFLDVNHSHPEGVSNKKLRKSIEDLSKLKKAKKIKLMNGVDTESPDTIKSSPKSVENQPFLNDNSNVKVEANDSSPREDFMPKKNKSGERTKNSLNDVSKLKKKRKIMRDENVNNSEVNKKKMKNTEHTIVIKKKKKATESGPVEGSTDSPKLTEESRLKDGSKNSGLPHLIHTDSTKVGEEVFSWMISPLSVKSFFKDSWEQKPVSIQHNDVNYFKHICTLEDFKKALRDHDMYFTRNIDVTSYIDGERHTENPEGKAKPSQVWDFYKNGRSIRLLNPQSFIQNVRMLNTILQEFFHCFVGANIYLTPPGTQGFAPHYDDIEAFVLQLEGEKHWKLYNPRSPEEVLPRESSRNFKEDEIGEPILEVTLKPGDLLYFPRGIIHQAKCLPHVHSLHITVSCYQKNSWADLMEKVIPVAVQRAITEDVEFRKGLPLGYLNSMGLVNSDKNSNQRIEIIKKFESLAQKIIGYCPLDAGIDQLGVGFVRDALPPCLTKVEELHGADRNCTTEADNFLDTLRESSDKNISVKLIRATCVRLVAEEEELWLYYTTDNSLVYHEQETSSVRISNDWAQALEYLIQSYPNFVEMKELPVSLRINKRGKWTRIVDFVYFLWQKGLLLFDQPLRQICA